MNNDTHTTEGITPDAEPRLLARRKVRAQSRFLAASYGLLALFGAFGLLFDRSLATWASVLLPAWVAGMEAFLGRRLAAAPSPRRLRLLLAFEALFLGLVWAMVAWLWRYPVAARVNEVAPDVRTVLEDLTETLGTTPEAYLTMIWKGTLLGLAALFALKIGIVSWRYWRWGRRA